MIYGRQRFVSKAMASIGQMSALCKAEVLCQQQHFQANHNLIYVLLRKVQS